MKINKYGLKMNRLKATAGETQYNNIKICGKKVKEYLQIDYKMDTGDILIYRHILFNDNKKYDDKNIINIYFNNGKKLTMQEIADAIYNKVEYYNMMGFVL